MILRQLPEAGAWPLGLLIVINLTLGLLPIGFIIATSAVVGAAPGAVADGVGSTAWGQLVRTFLIAATLFVIQQALIPVQLALGEVAKRRVDGRVHDRIMATALSSTSISPMENQLALDGLQQADRGLAGNYQTPGMACAGMLTLLARYPRLVGFAILVGVIVSWPAGLALVAAALVFRYGNRGGLRKYTQIGARLARLYRHSDYLRNLGLQQHAAKELRVFGLAGWIADRYEERHRAWLKPQARARRAIYVIPYLWYTALGLAIAIAVLILVALAAADGRVTLTELAIVLQATTAALLLGDRYPEADEPTQNGMLAVRGLDTFARVAASDQDQGGDAAARAGGWIEPATVEPPALCLDSVRFRYPDHDRMILDGLRLDLPAGRTTAIVGVNGAGKTTLVKLLTRLYEPTEGVIRLGGVDIREFPVAAWRRQISVVFQDFVRYEMSVIDNIALGAPHVPVERDMVVRAAERAGLLEVVEQLPLGFDTPLSRAYEGGVDLSGGQWQRIAIARSLYALSAGARILVLDEPTSALDVRAEADFFDHFVAITHGATVLLVSHRFSSVRRADTIAVIDGGRVIEHGTHDELVAADGRYAGLFTMQATRFTAGSAAAGEPVAHDYVGRHQWGASL